MVSSSPFVDVPIQPTVVSSRCLAVIESVQVGEMIWHCAVAHTETSIDTVSILGQDIIRCGFHLIPYIVETVLTTLPSSTYVLFTDTHLSKLYLDQFNQAFQEALTVASSSSSSSSTDQPRWISYSIPPGEQSKSREVKAELEDFLLSHRCTRDTVILALGGGVVGDLVGFVAASFMRGVRYCQIPTTLLAMVDSAGKQECADILRPRLDSRAQTAIDTPLGKNLIGAFYQPQYVFIDASFLESLPRREFVNGMAEVVKTAAIWDEDEFAKLEAGVEEIHSAVLGGSTRSTLAGRTLETRSPAQSLLLSVIRASIATKAHIVTIDEKETGLRNLVNFGHTIGHAIEAVMTPDVLHGECVGVGMVLEAEVARSLGTLGNAAVGRLARCIKAHGLPITLDDPLFRKSAKSARLSVETLLDIMRVDKKNSGNVKKIVLLSRIGKTYEERATGVQDDVIARTLSPAIKVFPGPPTVEHYKLATPGSKSISNRALVLAALGNGVCKLGNLLHSDDTQVMMSALLEMNGAEFSWEDNGELLVVKGRGGKLSPPKDNKALFLGNAGTASRFLATVCALVQPEGELTHTIITGNGRMKQRPIGPLVDALTANGTSVEYVEAQGSLPLKVKATKQGLRGGRIQLAASVSSQYVSSILLCAPYASSPIELELTGGQVISQSYIDLTIAMMASFGIQVKRLTIDGKLSNTYRIPLGTYKNPSTYNIESDASSATYPLALAAISGTSCTVQNIGSSSLQGDARFAKDVLEPMGCKVVQTETDTTVTGPPVGRLRALGFIDMEPMTDAFLTASALAAVAALPALPERLQPGQPANSTRIGGIANQRVKECNRIAAMRTQLAKFGVETDEFEDGIEILGIEPKHLKAEASVHCYDDHRVAMAFSVLAACPTAHGAIIEEKRCVEKTWPSWWDDLSRRMGIRIEGVELSDEPVASTSRPIPRHSTDASIFVLGMRGAGKTHLSKIGANALGWPVLDADEMFKTVAGASAKDFVHANGWPAFRAMETKILKKIVAEQSKGHVVSLGGGVVETPENRDILQAYGHGGGPILHVIRDIGDIVAYLNSEPTRPSLGEDLHDIYKRRRPWFHELSNFEFVNVIGGKMKLSNGKSDNELPTYTSTKGSEDEIARFFRFMTGQDTNHIELKGTQPTYFLCLTLPLLATPNAVFDKFEEVTAGVDALELRVDLLSPDGVAPTQPVVPSVAFVATQLAALRQRSTLPIVFTVRTVSQGGMCPDEAEDAIFELMELGVKSGCEYVDMETRWSRRRMRFFVNKKQLTKIICSWHDWTGALRWDSDQMVERYSIAREFGDVVKLVTKASSLIDNLTMMRFREKFEDGPPLMTLNIGSEGQLSRILNFVLSPVTHPALAASAPGQLSFAQVQTGLHLIGRLDAKKFYLFGTPIAHSKSPLIHNTSFETLGLPYRYGLHETTEVDDSVRKIIRAPDFGGASVTIPHKLEIMPLLDEVSDHAKLIGAVNTIIPVRTVQGTIKLRGDNTDWLGLLELIHKNLSADNERLPSCPALVLGAGGTSRAAIYTLHQAGFKTIYLFNRTLPNAQKIVASFPSEYNIVPLTSLEASFGGSTGREEPIVVISTIPAQGTSTEFFPNPDAGVVVTQSVFSRRGGGVMIDVAYKPKITPLIDLAQRCEGWVGIPGIQMLLEQGYWQSKMWTGRRPPKTVIAETVLEAYERDMK
ncbi:BQ2448_3470 [Microbotryum intermedium]|uniref:Pentafunctional AROM polypeptide n=1 Tax=Microbotryum intermedium TaxID=269621 RepID=A0A238FHR7_9BASI|nr:BQ2448_3470 [Microbotryum intermedium]